MAHVSHKLSNSLEGALAGGGDPATSPLYVFGPFLRLVVVAGVAQITFGTTVWLVVFTIAMVSAMYRFVMKWVTDGSGGSGLSEEEFGSWAVKVNAAITFIEYTLTFLVSMAALVTFLSDRFPIMNERFAGIQFRTFVAIALSLLTGWLVNRGPKVAARAFGPATGRSPLASMDDGDCFPVEARLPIALPGPARLSTRISQADLRRLCSHPGGHDRHRSLCQPGGSL